LHFFDLGRPTHVYTKQLLSVQQLSHFWLAIYDNNTFYFIDLKDGPKLLSRVQSLPLSDTSMQRRVCAIFGNIKEQLKGKFEDCVHFSLALDESTDIRDVSQLCVWVRFVDKELNVDE